MPAIAERDDRFAKPASKASASPHKACHCGQGWPPGSKPLIRRRRGIGCPGRQSAAAVPNTHFEAKIPYQTTPNSISNPACLDDKPFESDRRSSHQSSFFGVSYWLNDCSPPSSPMQSVFHGTPSHGGTRSQLNPSTRKFAVFFWSFGFIDGWLRSHR